MTDRTEPPAAVTTTSVEDDRLRLIFTCCHPALAAGGAGGAHAARGLRADDRRDRARLPHRARRRWPSASCAPRRRSATRAFPYQVPSRGRPARAARHACCTSSTWSSTRATRPRRASSLTRADLSAEAIRLGPAAGRAAAGAGGDRAARADAAAGIAARGARTTPEGDLILLEDQDRSLWNREQIAEGSRAGRAGAGVAARSARTRCRPPSRRCMPKRATRGGDRLGQIVRALRRAAARRCRRRWSS